MKAFLAVIILVAVAGCINLPTTSFSGSGLRVDVTTASSEVFAGRGTRVFVDVTNTNEKIVNDVLVEVFDVGSFTMVDPSLCKKQFDVLLPDQIVTLSCPLTADEHVIQKQETQRIHVRVTFKDVLVAPQTFDIVSEDYYQIEQAANQFTPAPSSYSYRDKNVQLDVEFSDTLPLIVRELSPAREPGTFVHFTIRNIGDGFIDSITHGKGANSFFVFNPQQVGRIGPRTFTSVSHFFDAIGTDEILYQNDNIIACEDFGTLQPIGKEFPRITCTLNLPRDRDFVVGYEITPVIYYTYEIRGSADVEVIR